MEFCNGGSLFDLMAKDPNARFPEDQIIGFIKVNPRANLGNHPRDQSDAYDESSYGPSRY